MPKVACPFVISTGVVNLMTVMDEDEDQLATKEFVRAELAVTQGELRTEIASTKTELISKISETKSELRAEMAELRDEMHTRFASVDTRFAQLEGTMDWKFAQQLVWLIGVVLTAFIAFTGMVGVLINLSG